LSIASGVFESDNIAATVKAFALYLERNGVKAESAATRSGLPTSAFTALPGRQE